MRRSGSHFGGNRRVRSGILYFLCLMAFLEGLRQNLHRLSPSPTSRAGPDSVLQALSDSLRQLPNPDVSRSRPSPLDSVVRGPEPTIQFPGSRANHIRETRQVLDLNIATPDQFQEILGVGPVLSARIVKFRNALGGFLDARQVYDVYGLPPEVARRLLGRFEVRTLPEVQKVNVNTAGVEELAGLVYLNYEMARELVRCRERYGPFKSLTEIGCATSIPKEKIGRIALYLTLTN